MSTEIRKPALQVYQHFKWLTMEHITAKFRQKWIPLICSCSAVGSFSCRFYPARFCKNILFLKTSSSPMPTIALWPTKGSKKSSTCLPEDGWDSSGFNDVLRRLHPRPDLLRTRYCIRRRSSTYSERSIWNLITKHYSQVKDEMSF
jgi:hypothetical protein